MTKIQAVHLPLNPTIRDQNVLRMYPHTMKTENKKHNDKKTLFTAHTMSKEYQMTKAETLQMTLNLNTPNAIRYKGWLN